ncbi:hypothetical protein N658DRAFT_459074 [Parathielavia hyrcaniae]|uniref:Secreted protein n=1 Tax=Parathielavia hyrcaniae TaxID=113614 RepID=A0AAN6PT70_9PEZI|nr:hypothetical protein N658DRAFT_459074 [Parathielavia hyrcaniae]
MKAITIISAAILLPSTVLAAVGGPCFGSHRDNKCICLDKTACVNTWGGTAVQGSPGNWPCPYDADNVWGCRVWDNCPTLGTDTGCVWRNISPGCVGTPLPNPVCPGGTDFICCDYF